MKGTPADGAANNNTTNSALAAGANQTESDLSNIKPDRDNSSNLSHQQSLSKNKKSRKKSRNKGKEQIAGSKNRDGVTEQTQDANYVGGGRHEVAVADPDMKRQNDMILDEVERHDGRDHMNDSNETSFKHTPNSTM